MMPDHRFADPDNAQVGEWLRQAAEFLQAQGANPFRVGAYRKAADTVERFNGSLRTLFAMKGRDGLDALPGIGAGFASAIAEMLETGRWAQLERLRGSLDPTTLFQTVPGIGPELAQRIHDALGVETLEALEVACHEGRLGEVAGVGRRRVAAIRAALAEILDRSRLRRRTAVSAAVEPSVELLLDVDREYLDILAKDHAGFDSLPVRRSQSMAASTWADCHQIPRHAQGGAIQVKSVEDPRKNCLNDNRPLSMAIAHPAERLPKRTLRGKTTESKIHSALG